MNRNAWSDRVRFGIARHCATTASRPILRSGTKVVRRAVLLTAVGLCAGIAGPVRDAWAQAQSDHIGRLLGTAPKTPSVQPGDDGGKAAGAEPLRAPIALRAGQSVVVRAGASAVAVSPQAAPLAFKLGRRPGCGTAWETPQGIVLEAGADCVGRTLEFDYEVGVTGAEAGRQNTVKVAVQAVVQSGIESCGIANAPYGFAKIPGGTYSLQSPPSQLSDLVKLLGAASVTVEPFCITEEAVPAAEMEAFLARQSLAQKRRALPEALAARSPLAAQVELGRAGRPPALAVSYRMAKVYAERQSEVVGQALHLPRIEHYAASAIHLLRQQADAPLTNSFFVSLRGGLMEWTDTPCDPAAGTFVMLGTKRQSGLLNKYCYEISQRVARMSFRLVSTPQRKNAPKGH